MKLPNNWKNSSLQVLEGEDWGDPPGEAHSFLVNRCHKLRRVPLIQFEVEDLRLLIGQQIGLPYLIPLAIEILKTDLFAEGDFYPGDLLKAVLDINVDFWKSNRPLRLEIDGLIRIKLQGLRRHKISTEKFYSAKRG